MLNRTYGLIMASLIVYGIFAQVYVNFAEANFYFLVTGILTAWLVADSIDRNCKFGHMVLWIVSSLLLAPIVVARWYSTRKLLPGEVRKFGADANFFNAFGVITLIFTGVSAALNFIDFGGNRGFEIIINSGFAVAGTAIVMAIASRRESVTETGRPLATQPVRDRDDN